MNRETFKAMRLSDFRFTFRDALAFPLVISAIAMMGISFLFAFMASFVGRGFTHKELFDLFLKK